MNGVRNTNTEMRLKEFVYNSKATAPVHVIKAEKR
jgi:hypothetical protein